MPEHRDGGFIVTPRGLEVRAAIVGGVVTPRCLIQDREERRSGYALTHSFKLSLFIQCLIPLVYSATTCEMLASVTPLSPEQMQLVISKPS